MLKRQSLIVTPLAAVLVLGSFYAARADDEQNEETIAATDLPAAVLQTVKQDYPKATITECDKEREDGKPVYSVELKVGSRELELKLDPAGSLLETDERLALTQLPEAVTNALQTILADGHVREAARRVARGKTTYEVEVGTGGVVLELDLSKSGRVLRLEVKNDEQEERDNQDEQVGEHED